MSKGGPAPHEFTVLTHCRTGLLPLRIAGFR